MGVEIVHGPVSAYIFYTMGVGVLRSTPRNGMFRLLSDHHVPGRRRQPLYRQLEYRATMHAPLKYGRIRRRPRRPLSIESSES